MVIKKRGNYKQLDEEEFYRVGTNRGVVKVSEEQKSKIKIVSFSKEFQKDEQWIPKRGKFFPVSFRFIGKIVDILIKFAEKFGWKVSSLEKPDEQIKELKKKLDETLKQKLEIEKINERLEFDIKNFKELIHTLRESVIKENLEKFQKDIKDFEDLLTKSETEIVKEEELQRFLKERPWIFSPEYHSVEPKKPAGSKGVFDFYLEDYKGQGTVIELEKPSDEIFSKQEKYGLSPKCGETFGQLIRYCEDTISIAHSGERREIEKIYEIRPLGFLIIGRTKNADDNKRLKIVNSYFHSVEILSYNQLLSRAKTFVEPWLNSNEKQAN